MNKIRQLLKRIRSTPTWLWRLLKNPFDTAQTSAYLLLILGAGAAIIGYLQQYVYSDWLNFLDNPIADFYANTSSELISIAITVLIIEQATRKQNEEERKDELIFQLGSEDNSTALAAARMLRHKGWLQDGSLRGVNLENANLQRANLEGANLQGVLLRYADLRAANLENAILPDGSKWTNKTNMDRFVDPRNPDFKITLVDILRERMR